jgi:hypothetical protein
VDFVESSDRTDAAWSAQIGPAMSENDVARLLRKTTSAVRTDEGMLRVSNGDGRIVYPVAQFDDNGQVPGLADAAL